MRALALACCVLAGCSGPSSGPDGLPASAVPSGTKQVVVVHKSKDNPDGPVMLTAWEYSGGWKAVQGPMPCTIGNKGFAPPGDKREGDGRTPSGVYRIGMAFGYERTIDTKLDYKDSGADDFWVDDPDSPQYNRRTKGAPAAKSFEKLRRDDDAYKYAAVIEYNTDPVVPGKGSAIFLHVWAGPEKPTAGCVAVAQDEMVKLLSWFDKRRKPVIVLNEP
jgi:L,D-peptidoglycan transpeptidase YkuD (ErfK/YbiS/YcfS/YnhG family)